MIATLAGLQPGRSCGRPSLSGLLLTGIAVSAFAGAATSVLLVSAEEFRVKVVLFWLAGGLGTLAVRGGSPKAAKANPFSKFRATIKGKSSTPKAEEKVEDKPAEVAKEEAAVKSKPEETTAAPVVEPSTETAPVAATDKVEEPENKPENVSTTTPAVTAAA